MTSSGAGLAFAPFIRREPLYSIILEDRVFIIPLRRAIYQICSFVSQLCISCVAATESYLEDGYSVACRGR